jgi:hypothetical protein
MQELHNSRIASQPIGRKRWRSSIVLLRSLKQLLRSAMASCCRRPVCAADELALLFIRLYRSLSVRVGNDRHRGIT